MSPRTCYLINPLSGNYQGQIVADQIRHLIATEQLTGEVREMDFSNIVNQLSDISQFEHLVVAGGDGTVASAIQTLAGKNIALGIIPLGTANDLARELKIKVDITPSGLAAYLNKLRNGSNKSVQIWHLSSPHHTCYFSNYVSFGFTGRVVNEFSKWRGKDTKSSNRYSKTLNRAIYGFLGLKYTFQKHLLPFEVTIGNQSVQLGAATSILFTNIQSYLGIGQSNGAANCEEGLLYVLLTNSPFNYFSMILPTLRHLSKPSELEPATKAIIKFDQPGVYYQIDGEPFYADKDLTFEISPAFKQRILVA